jgi:hypothetical protein
LNKLIPDVVDQQRALTESGEAIGGPAIICRETCRLGAGGREIVEKKEPEAPQASTDAEIEACRAHREDLLDEALAESFPASDPPSIFRPPRTTH